MTRNCRLELDDRGVVGLEGVIRLACWGTGGSRRPDVEGFALTERWAELCPPQPPSPALAEAHKYSRLEQVWRLRNKV